MRIAIDLRCLDTAERTGVGEFTASLLEAVFKQDTKHSYTLFTNALRHSGHTNFAGTNIQNVVGTIPNKLLNTLTLSLGRPQLDQIIKRKTGDQPDLFFSPNLNFTALSSRTKHLLVVHDISFLLFPEYFTAKQRLWHRLARLKKQTQRATHIITPSEHTKNDLVQNLHVPNEKITVIYPGVPSFITGLSGSLALPDKYILSVGTIEPRKNSFAIIDAFEKVHARLPVPYTLLIAGAHGSLSNQLKKRIAISPLHERIRYLGYCTPPEKKQLYEKATLMIYPSLYEGFGFPVLEAMALGTPVIASNRSSLPEVGGQAAYYVNPHHTEEIAEGLMRLLNQPTLRNELKQKGLARAESFSWAKTAETWLKLIETV